MAPFSRKTKKRGGQNVTAVKGMMETDDNVSENLNTISECNNCTRVVRGTNETGCG